MTAPKMSKKKSFRRQLSKDPPLHDALEDTYAIIKSEGVGPRVDSCIPSQEV